MIILVLVDIGITFPSGEIDSSMIPGVGWELHFDYNPNFSDVLPIHWHWRSHGAGHTLGDRVGPGHGGNNIIVITERSPMPYTYLCPCPTELSGDRLNVGTKICLRILLKGKPRLALKWNIVDLP